MKCRVCGCELNPTKRYCEKCGALVEGPVKKAEGEFAWNTIDFPKPKKIEDIEMTWPGMDSKPNRSYMNEDASEGFVSHNNDDLDAKPVKRQKQQTSQQPQQIYQQPNQFSWTMPSSAWTAPPQQQVVIPQPYNVAPPQPQPVYVQPQTPIYMTQPIPAVPVQTMAGMAPVQTVAGIQPVVPVQTMAGMAPVQTMAGIQPVQAMPIAQAPVQTMAGIQPVVPMQTVAGMQPVQQMPQTEQTQAPQTPPVGSVDLDSWLDDQLKDAGEERKEQFFTFYKKNEDFQKLLDQEYEKYRNKYNTNAESLKLQSVLAAATAAAAVHDATSGKDSVSGDTIARTKPFSSSEIKRRASKKEEPAKDLFPKEAITDFDKMMIEGTTNTAESGDSTLVISNAELKKEIDEVAEKVEAAYGRKDLEEMAAARMQFLQPKNSVDDMTSAVEIRSIFDEWDKEREKEQRAKEQQPKKKCGFGKVLLVLLLIIVLFVGADYASLRFLGDTPVTEFFVTVNAKAADFVEKAKITLGLAEEIKEPERELTVQEQAAQMVNTNIEEITCDVESSKFSKQGTYGFSNIGSMTIVTDEDTVIDVTETLVRYNCAWIDYVNSGTDITCFDYLKADGEAFRSASNFDGIGKVKESFKKLNIGEIRKDSKYVYVFADEYIIVKKGNSTTEIPSRMIYQMELVGDMYKIVQYDAYL